MFEHEQLQNECEGMGIAECATSKEKQIEMEYWGKQFPLVFEKNLQLGNTS